ncbi:MAG: hypothetical protein JSU74_01700 [Candidatus Zixiibacteriota bacterium]|nr:MAG: hypothetical protein JSU74_01700 [candidate division Zixibacteria bacterium]
MKRLASLFVLAALAVVVLATPLYAAGEFDVLTEGQINADFKLKTIYENEYGDAVGAEFRHVPSNFVLDVLRIQSVPQGFIWVNTPPPTDAGEPHAMEHLVLGKGPKGQWVASFEDMSLSSSSAGTGQTVTGYHYYSSAGKETFFKLMEVKIDALINPDFTDEEIRREMCNLGYSVNPEDSSYQLEEKGSVFTEMVSYHEGTWYNMSLKLDDMMYGSDHPLSNSSGGYPPAIREATAEDLRKFHGDYYHLNNMGMVVAIPDEIALEEFLSRTSEIFGRIEPDAQAGEDPAALQERFPEPEMAPFGTIAIADFPHQNEKEPGMLMIAWPPVLPFEFNEALLRELLVYNLAGDESSNLYKRFVDSQTRLMDVGASDVFGWTAEVQGCPTFIGLANISQDAINEPTIDSIRALVIKELETVSGFSAGSDELKEFNDRIANRVTFLRRQLRSNMNRPPGFGFRGASFWWMHHLHLLYRTEGFTKKLTTNERLEFVEDLLASGENFWRDYIAKWKLLENKPYAVGTRANPEMINTMERERDTRIEGYIEDLKKQYSTDDREQALAAFVADYDVKTAEIDARSAAVETPGFVENPPLSLDEHLQYRIEKLPGGGDNLVSTFNNITSAQIALYLDMSVVPEDLLVYVSALPTMLTEVGVIKDGKPLAYDEASQLQTKEILGIGVGYDVNYYTERVELEVTASGSTLEESAKAIEWMATYLFDADWRIENLPRMRDAVDIDLTWARNGMKGSEEYWVGNPINAYWKQSNPLILASNSFLTRQHTLLRIKWMLQEADEQSRQEFESFMAELGAIGADGDRDRMSAVAKWITSGEISEEQSAVDHPLMTTFESLSETTTELVKAAADDLLQNLSTLPDGSLADDWQYLCERMVADLAVPPQEALDNFKAVMEIIRKKDNVRGYLVGSEASQEALLPLQNSLVARFSDETSLEQIYSSTPVINSRLKQRTSPEINPVYVGLMNENTRNGVFSNNAPLASYWDTDPETLLDFLSARLYGGGGAHSMFMKTWAAGLAYSNGLRSNQFTGRLTYYAERCPSLVQTMQFVVSELKKAEPDPGLTEYTIAQAFGGGRAGSTYERRTEAMATNLVDGLTPEVVANFRKAILELRQRPDLYELLTSRMLDVYGTVLPGLDPKGAEVEGASYLMIGPEMQFESFEDYLHTVEGDDVTLYRIYPRDFWLVATD